MMSRSRKHTKIAAIASEIERRRIAFEQRLRIRAALPPRPRHCTSGGMKRHFEQMKRILKPGARLAYVVGDQASYLQVLIRTGRTAGRHCPRRRLRCPVPGPVQDASLNCRRREQLREEVLVLEWPGDKRMPPKKDPNRLRSTHSRTSSSTTIRKGAAEVHFAREEFAATAKSLGMKLPLNLGDIIYSYRYRNKLPARIRDLLAPDEEWLIRSEGRGKYVFAKSAFHAIAPNPRLSRVKVPDATPEIVRRYALNDEQALLAILRYNRLVDIFTGTACYSLQSHLRTFVEGIGQVETDEI